MHKQTSVVLIAEVVTPAQALEAANTQGVRLKVASYGDGVIFTIPAENAKQRYAFMEAIREPLKKARVYPHKSDPRKFCMFHAVVIKQRNSNASLGFSLSAEVFSANA